MFDLTELCQLVKSLYAGRFPFLPAIMVTACALFSLRAPLRGQQQSVCGGASTRGITHQRRDACIAHVSSSTIGVGRNDKVELETLAREILNKENEIKNAFQPGRPMPKVRSRRSRKTNGMRNSQV